MTSVFTRYLLSAALLLGLGSSAVAQPIRPMVGKLQRVVTGDNDDLWKIAFNNRLAVDHMAFANGLHISTMVAPPQTPLIVPTWRILPTNPPRNGIVINLPERGCYLFQNGHFTGFYPVSIGDEVLEKNRFWTRTGSFYIQEKEKNPTWYPPSWAKDRRPVGPGPNNPLGDRWIGLSLERTGIHGTADPLNVGNSVTHGCMRTYPELVRELYDKVQVGWPARIEYEVAKVGRGPDGKVYVVTFPDVYRRADPVKSALAQLQRLGLSKRIKRSNFRDILALGLGFPVRIDGEGPLSEEVAKATEPVSLQK